ncbi:TetR/AcrR family transcriptional regulator [Oceanospirillum beijerinckii]|uniref:TetR/AcrR family transcriptional regulator n=1 Tax=Oceanospirillum beijerinckii TaxID=64976 RepID=UPI0003FB6AAA|nr:TetR/AcrR family transcriptional regulator [Oceanospirillum beijerinckii]
MSKTRSKSEEKRLQILSAAKDLFCAQGFTAISMDMIAKEAGVSKQTVYSHFGNKDELFTAAIEQKCVSLKFSEIQLREDISAREVITLISRSFSQMILSEDAMQVHRASVSEAYTNPTVARLFYATGPMQVIEQVAKILRSLDESGKLKVEEPRMASVQLLKMLQGEARMEAEYNIEARQSEAEINAYIQNCIDMFLRAYAP